MKSGQKKAQAVAIESLELLMTYHRHPSLELRNQLVQLNVGLVRQVAHRFSGYCAEPYEDLEQIGYFGLIQAIERFNPHQGRAFSSFAMPYIRGEILHYLRDRGAAIRIPRRWQDLHSRSRSLSKQLAVSLGRQPQARELVVALGVSLEEWQECQLAMQNRLLVSLDAAAGKAADASITLGETIPDWGDRTQQEWTEERGELQGALSQLEERTKTAIECIFFQELSRKETAKSIGMSPITVTRHLKRGIGQLQALLDFGF
jgi:RNA polymerase sigma-B factor